jgi:hypothetical protein
MIEYDNLSGGDPLKWDIISEKPMMWFLNMVDYYRDKQEAINEQYRKVNR